MTSEGQWPGILEASPLGWIRFLDDSNIGEELSPGSPEWDHLSEEKPSEPSGSNYSGAQEHRDLSPTEIPIWSQPELLMRNGSSPDTHTSVYDTDNPSSEVGWRENSDIYWSESKCEGNDRDGIVLTVLNNDQPEESNQPSEPLEESTGGASTTGMTGNIIDGGRTALPFAAYAAISYLSKICVQFPEFQVHLLNLKLLTNAFQREFLRSTHGSKGHVRMTQTQVQELETRIWKRDEGTGSPTRLITIRDEEDDPAMN